MWLNSIDPSVVVSAKIVLVDGTAEVEADRNIYSICKDSRLFELRPRPRTTPDVRQFQNLFLFEMVEFVVFVDLRPIDSI